MAGMRIWRAGENREDKRLGTASLCGTRFAPATEAYFPTPNNLITLFGISHNALTITQNAMGPPSPTSPSLASESDIEMASLDEICVSPKHYDPRDRDTAQSPPNDHDSDDDDGGERALLGESTQTRWKEKPLSISLGFWKQTSGIVVEVSVSSFRSSVSNLGPGTLDITDSALHDVE
jgi:hypothetical protein